ncbi:hypothetical protein BJ138DRAFT_869582 [Hygrophoropsis aurantiaca]|uniref:Uncharacterized protein n=1 Tax=Hygrophoropsis aurantiaca TaxID=72124 RepID=A0ACB8AGE1_9AGAM|nr:hypothetical protein BJ138DRAFT_869582 [Hygrophoropsis aurantiaca]
MAGEPIYFPIQPSTSTAATKFLQSLPSSIDPPGESELLKNIRSALRGPATSSVTTTFNPYFDQPSGTWIEQELSWNQRCVVLSHGGIITRKWDFKNEGQIVQFACIANLAQTTDRNTAPAHGSAHYTSTSDENRQQTSTEAHIFGPFSRARDEAKKYWDQKLEVPGVFVFLRSIGKIFLQNGMDYTFSLPFLVRKAWPLHPHGVLIQRVLDIAEVEEAQITGDPPLPTLFSITNPFSEPAPVGITAGILGGSPGVPVSLTDEEDNCKKPLNYVPASEEIVWISQRVAGTSEDIIVTMNQEKFEMTIWRYAYLKPKDQPVPLSRSRTRSLSRKRTSMSGIIPGRRRQSNAIVDSTDYDRRLPILPNNDSPDTSTAREFALPFPAVRRDSLARGDLSLNLDRMALGSREADALLAPVEHGRMKAAYWMQSLFTHRFPDNFQITPNHSVSVAMFDRRFDGKSNRSQLVICVPPSPALLFTVSIAQLGQPIIATFGGYLPLISAQAIRATRTTVWDLIAVKNDHTMSLFIHGLQEVPIKLSRRVRPSIDSPLIDNIIALKDPCISSLTAVLLDNQSVRVCISLIPQDDLVDRCLRVLSLVLPGDTYFGLHRRFLEEWSSLHLRSWGSAEFDAFTTAIWATFNICIVTRDDVISPNSWQAMSNLPGFGHFDDDPALKGLILPKALNKFTFPVSQRHQPLLAPVLYGLHMLAEDLRLVAHQYSSLHRLASLIINIALVNRPEWADYWKRLCPSIPLTWSLPPHEAARQIDDRIPVWPPDMSAILYGRISNPEWEFPSCSTHEFATLFQVTPSFAYGSSEPLQTVKCLTAAYMCLADKTITSTQKRAERTVEMLIQQRGTARSGIQLLDSLPLGIAAPLREAIRTCQLSPPSSWSPDHYELIGRRDLAYSVAQTQPDISHKGLFLSADTYMSKHRRTNISTLITQAKSASLGEVDAVSGVELDLEGFTDIRFGQDRRLEEAARILCSSTIPSVRILERPDLNEHDQAKEQQHQVVRIAERTLALPYGRAMFTFGTVQTVTREAYVIPKLEYSVRIQPLNVISAPEAGKIPQDCTNWGEFHNGVAAGLRISPSARGVESSWIAFNKPSELTPEHAGFLFGLGLTGHLKEMLTWHTFGYLTPKHDLTSIGVLLGLSAANIGTSNRHVTKLLAVHTPALLPTPSVDLNVSLMTQAAGLAGVGLLYLGTKNRRMAEVCLNQISRRDLVQPDLSNEHREAYTYSAALAFGMTMLGQGSSVPADLASLNRLRILIHGENKAPLNTHNRPIFDVNITSPAASIALGLMYLKTGRRDVADILEIPSTVLELNRIQPGFLLLRTIARALIMWDSIASTHIWLGSQIPEAISRAMRDHATGKPADDSMELAYYNIVAGCCFAIGLKYAGTARHEAYLLILNYFDMYSRFVAGSGPSFDHKIKRSTVREGLNLISIAVCMVMAGTGEISCLRRLRYAYGMYHQAFRYGVHVATHMSLGLLFLGGGRYTLGTSNSAIACMIAAFFPRFHHVSSDNKSYLQALRHLWVLAVEPRCLIARDVNTREAVYLPVKITGVEGNQRGVSQFISPTLIPDFDRLLSIKIDTPRYWPFLIDLENVPQHRARLLKNQTLYVKRRTAFLSYTEDPRGSRSLFVRSGSSAGDAATLDFPQLTDATVHPSSDLTHFISSFSNDILFLAFADYFSRNDGDTSAEKIFHNYCHAALLDSILQDKIETLQSHLILYQYRTQSIPSRFFHLRLQDLRFAMDFYSKVYDRRFSGRSENNFRPPLIRQSTISGALLALDAALEAIQNSEHFKIAFSQYARGEFVHDAVHELGHCLAWYLLRNGVPVSSLLMVMRTLAQDAYANTANVPPPAGTTDLLTLDQGVKEVLHGTGTKMTTAFGSGWSFPSLLKVVEAWRSAP